MCRILCGFQLSISEHFHQARWLQNHSMFQSPDHNVYCEEQFYCICFTFPVEILKEFGLLGQGRSTSSNVHDHVNLSPPPPTINVKIQFSYDVDILLAKGVSTSVIWTTIYLNRALVWGIHIEQKKHGGKFHAIVFSSIYHRIAVKIVKLLNPLHLCLCFQLIRTTHIHILPTVNPDGGEHSKLMEGTCYGDDEGKTNAQGVNLENDYSSK